MGTSLALFLARRGTEVVLIDAAEEPMARASRWNEGKIHLGYLYAGDATLATAARVLPGGLRFRPLVEELVGEPLDEAATPQDDIYLVHRESVVDADAMGRYFSRLTELVRDHQDAAGYFRDLPGSAVHRLERVELEGVADCRVITAGFRVPERSVSTAWVADRLVDALRSEPRIAVHTGVTVTGLAREARGGWRIQTEPPLDQTADVVVNALWERRIGIDQSLGLEPGPGWSHRHRLSLFMRLPNATALPSAVVATGPFGDVKNYNGRDLYVSWYPAGLTAEGHDIAPPDLPVHDAAALARVAQETVDGLAGAIPGLPAAVAGAQVDVAGGWVFAQGRGSLADARSTLHRRDRFGVRRFDGYFSVDTGKYSTAPWMARRLADEIADGASPGVPIPGPRSGVQ
jgi:glycine/D-amino acid oxidase-like deaminating enzyme